MQMHAWPRLAGWGREEASVRYAVERVIIIIIIIIMKVVSPSELNAVIDSSQQ